MADRKSPLLSSSSSGGYQPPPGVTLPAQHMSLQYNSTGINGGGGGTASAVESSPLLNSSDYYGGGGSGNGCCGGSCCARLCGPVPLSSCCLLVPNATASSSSSAAVMAMALHHHHPSNPGTWTAIDPTGSGGTPLPPALVMQDDATGGGGGGGLFSPTAPPASYATLESGAGVSGIGGGGNACGCPSLCGSYTAVACLLVALCAGSTTELVMRKVVATNLYNYRWFMTQLLCAATFVVSGVIALVRRHAIRRDMKHHLAKSGWPTKAMLYMAILDSAHSMCLFVAVGVVSGPVSVLLPQLVVPLSLLYRAAGGGRASSVVPGGSPPQPTVRLNHVLAIFILFGGVMASFLPGTLSYSQCSSGGRSSHEWTANVVILALGCIPAVLSHGYKTKFLSKTAMDPFFLNACVSLFQFLIGMILAPIALELQYLSAAVPPPQTGPDPTPEPPVAGGGGTGSGGASGSDGGAVVTGPNALAVTAFALISSALSSAATLVTSSPAAAGAASSVAASASATVAAKTVLVAPAAGASMSAAAAVSMVVVDPYPIATDTTAPYTKNIFTNFGRGLGCVFGHVSGSFQDQCETLGPQLSWDIAGYVLAMVASQVAIAMLMRRLVNAGPLVSWGLLLGIFFAVLSFFTAPVKGLLPVADGVDCLSMGSDAGLSSIVGAVVVCIGLAVAAIEPAPAPASTSGGGAASDEIDVWAQFEALEAADETRAAERRAQKEREREARDRKRRERDPHGFGAPQIPQIPRFQQRKADNADDGGAAPVPAHQHHTHLTRAQQAAAAAAAAGETAPGGETSRG